MFSVSLFRVSLSTVSSPAAIDDSSPTVNFHPPAVRPSEGGGLDLTRRPPRSTLSLLDPTTSSLSFTRRPPTLRRGLVKILKKYDKLSGALIRLPFIQKVLQEPFFTTDVLNQLVKECETMLDQFFSMNEQLVVTYQAAEAKEEFNTMTGTKKEGRYFRDTFGWC